MEMLQSLAAQLCSAAFLAALAFVALDVVTGYAQAVANRDVSSSKMREGFWHKLALVLTLVVAGLADAVVGYGSAALDLGFAAPVFEGACAYVAVMELTSILENLKRMNPALAGSGLMRLLGGGDGEGEDRDG